VSEMDKEIEHVNKINMRKLWCDVYTLQMEKHGEGRLARVEADNAIVEYSRRFNQAIKEKAPEGAKE